MATAGSSPTPGRRVFLAGKAPVPTSDLVSIGALICGVLLLCCIVLVVTISGPTAVLRSALGLSSVQETVVPRTVSVEISSRIPSFTPGVAVAAIGSSGTFTNRLNAPILVRSAAHDPTQFTLRIAADGQGTIHLAQPGLYHYYDALTSRPRDVVAGNDVIASMTGANPPRQGWIAVLTAIPGLSQPLNVPPNHDLFAPKVLVAVVGSTITVSNHDTDAHNFVVDPASPAGAAFIINGSDTEPPDGWRRSLVVQQSGLYHVYCTLHTKVVGKQGGWNVVVPKPSASGYMDHDPMEAWIIVLPANVTI